MKNLRDVKPLADSDYDHTNLKIKRITENGSKVVSDLNDSFNPEVFALIVRESKILNYKILT